MGLSPAHLEDPASLDPGDIEVVGRAVALGIPGGIRPEGQRPAMTEAEE
jgi:hypothetical protein